MPSHGGRLAVRVARAAAARGALRVLLLDLDGTLAPIAPSPEQARVPRDTLAALRRLVGCGWTVAVVSGRPASQVRRLVPVRGTHVFGSHGMEGSWDAATGVGQVEPRTRRRLGALARDARRLAAGTAGAHIERKPAGIAFHDRRVPPGRLGAWRQRLRAWLADEDLDGLEVLRGRRVVELRVLGINKGIVARRLLRDH